MNFREPVEYIVSRHEKKKNTKISVIENANDPNLNLPEYPVRLLRDETKKVIKIIYSEGTDSQWSRELIRNSKGQVYKMKTIFPDSSSKTVKVFRNSNLVEYIDYV